MFHPPRFVRCGAQDLECADFKSIPPRAKGRVACYAWLSSIHICNALHVPFSDRTACYANELSGLMRKRVNRISAQMICHDAMHKYTHARRGFFAAMQQFTLLQRGTSRSVLRCSMVFRSRRQFPQWRQRGQRFPQGRQGRRSAAGPDDFSSAVGVEVLSGCGNLLQYVR